jgi:hypothetical protein
MIVWLTRSPTPDWRRGHGYSPVVGDLLELVWHGVWAAVRVIGGVVEAVFSGPVLVDPPSGPDAREEPGEAPAK